MRWKIAQWFEERWWNRYLADKQPDDYLGWKKGYWLNFLKQVDVAPPSEASILDAGCGPAGIFTVLIGNAVTATDPLIERYEKSLAHFQKSRYPWVEFHPTPIEEIGFHAKFDVVCCLNVINHVKDIELSYDNLIRALKQHGTLIMSIDSHNFWFPRLFFRLLPFDILHPHQYSLNEYENALTKRGMHVERSIKMKSGFLFDYYALVATKN